MNRFGFVLTCFFLIATATAQKANQRTLQRGVNFIPTEVYSASEDAAVLKLYEGLRVADVSDGLDQVGLAGTGLVNPEILPLWKDMDGLTHQIRGIAITARYVPTRDRNQFQRGDDFSRWEGHWYTELSSETWTQLIRRGTVVVLDDVETMDCGTIGSFNILAWFKAGAVGVVTDAGSRDTDEIILEKVPLYLRKRSRGIRPGRNVLESVNRPVVIGGVTVCPGDVIVADGDGVVVVPRPVAKEVARFAKEILRGDKAGRKQLYESLDMELDQTVQ